MGLGCGRAPGLPVLRTRRPSVQQFVQQPGSNENQLAGRTSRLIALTLLSDHRECQHRRLTCLFQDNAVGNKEVLCACQSRQAADQFEERCLERPWTFGLLVRTPRSLALWQCRAGRQAVGRSQSVCCCLGGRPAVTIHCHSEVGLPLARITVVARSFVATILGPQDYAHG